MLLAFLYACGVPGDFVIRLTDQANFTYSASLNAESTVIEGYEDARLDWSGLTSDLLGNSISPATDIEQIAILHFPRLTEEQVLIGIDHETLKQSDLNAYVEFAPESGQTDAMLTAFSMQGVFVDPSEHLPSDSGTYLLTFSAADDATVSLVFFSPEAEGDNEIEVTSSSANLSASVDLTSMDPMAVIPAERYVVDWSELTQSGTDRDLILGNLDRFTLAGFNTELAVLESSFFSLTDMAVQEFHAEVMGQTAVDLSVLVSNDGTLFSGFNPDLTWLVFLRCSMCVNPSPLFVGSLDVGSK